MRCRAREEPWGSHQVAARALKWEISSALTEEEEGPGLALWLECHRCVVVVVFDGDAVAMGAEHCCGVDAMRAIVLGFRTRRVIVGANWRSGADCSMVVCFETLLKLERAPL